MEPVDASVLHMNFSINLNFFFACLNIFLCNCILFIKLFFIKLFSSNYFYQLILSICNHLTILSSKAIFASAAGPLLPLPLWISSCPARSVSSWRWPARASGRRSSGPSRCWSPPCARPSSPGAGVHRNVRISVFPSLCGQSLTGTQQFMSNWLDTQKWGVPPPLP